MPGGKVQISIRDSGVGMPQDVKDKLFKPFFTTKPKGKGTGLGLSVSRKIVAHHRGEILVESELGKARPSSFACLLPFPREGEARSARVLRTQHLQPP